MVSSSTVSVLAIVALIVVMRRYWSEILGALDLLARLPFLQPKERFFHQGFIDPTLEQFRRPLMMQDGIAANFCLFAAVQKVAAMEDIKSDDGAERLRKALKSNQHLYSFLSPAADLLPPACHTGYFEEVLSSAGRTAPWCILLAATGDEGFSHRRKRIAQPLAERHGVNTLILGIPFYGRRRLPGMTSYALPRVEHVSAQAYGCVKEAIAALNYVKQFSEGPFVFAGQSYGGSMAAFASALCHEPHALVTACAASGPRDAFIDGLLAGRVALTIDRELLDQALSSVDLRQADITDVDRDALFLYAADDTIVSRTDALRLVEAFRDLSPTSRIRTMELAGGHVSTLLLRNRLFVDSIGDIVTMRKIRKTGKC